jgi:hypothetical protein
MAVQPSKAAVMLLRDPTAGSGRKYALTTVRSRAARFHRPFSGDETEERAGAARLGLFDACPRPWSSRAHDRACGQALNKPRGRKPRAGPMRPASSLWRLIGLTGLCGGSTAGDAGVRRGVAAAVETMSRAILSSEYGRGTVNDTEGTTVPLSVALTQSRRLNCRSKRGAHRCAAFGGARIGTVRVRISMTSIGAPQWRQIKIGRSTTTASCDDGQSLRATPSSVRIFTRLARRTGLASNP